LQSYDGTLLFKIQEIHTNLLNACPIITGFWKIISQRLHGITAYSYNAYFMMCFLCSAFVLISAKCIYKKQAPKKQEDRPKRTMLRPLEWVLTIQQDDITFEIYA
jgi:hypothetical protein